MLNRLCALRKGLCGPQQPARAHADSLAAEAVRVRSMRKELRAALLFEQTPGLSGLRSLGSAGRSRPTAGRRFN